ncbi:MAG: type II secretion system F family protein [Candidatus Omnitrophota bacterium]
MPMYSYIARDGSGRVKSDMVEAFNEQALVEKLQAQGFYIVKFSETLQMIHAETKKQSKVIKFTHNKVKLQDLLVFSRQLATMLEAGVALMRSLDVILPQINSQELYNVTKQLHADVESGKSLSQGLNKHPKIFSQFWVSLAEVGEASGTMPNVLNKLANHVEEQAAFRATIISAIIYPCILCFVTVGAVVFFALVVAPRFEEIFNSMHAELPVMTKMLLGTFKFIKQNILFIFGGATGIFFLAGSYFKTPKGALKLETILFNVPLLGEILKLIVVERYTAQMAILIGAGVPILLSLDIIQRLVENRTCALLIAKIHEEVREGKGLADSMAKEPFFPNMAVQMIKVGEETGELAKMFNHVAAFYKTTVENFMKRFSTIFEPFMLVFMAAVIGIIVVSIFLPLFKLGQGGGLH